MPFQFDPAKYKNIFDGEFGESPLQPQTNNPGAEVWNVKIYKLKEENGQLVKFTQNAPCHICGDNLSHEHQWLYESDRPSSPTADFIYSLRDHGNLVISGPKDIEGRQFRFEEHIRKGGTNPQTGLPGKDRRYFMVIGPVGVDPEDIDDSAPAPQANTNANVVITPPQNGSPAVAQVSTHDLLKYLAQVANGKSSLDLDAIRAEAKAMPAIFDNKAFYINVLNGMAFEEMIQKGYATRDENNLFHSTV